MLWFVHLAAPATVRFSSVRALCVCVCVLGECAGLRLIYAHIFRHSANQF